MSKIGCSHCHLEFEKEEMIKELDGGKELYFCCTIKQNIGISLVYNLITMPLAMAGFVISLVVAISMSFSSIVVVLNSIALWLPDSWRFCEQSLLIKCACHFVSRI